MTGPYLKNFSSAKDGNKAYFAIRQQFMGEIEINRAKEKDYPKMEAAKYHSELQSFTYESCVLIFENNMHRLSRNNEEMRDARADQKFLLGIKWTWFAAGKFFVTSSDAHKNYLRENNRIFGQFCTTWQGRR